MNFYDYINNLVASFKDTDEYKNYMRLKEEVKKDSEKYNRLKEFKDKQSNAQMQYINGKDLSKEEQEKMQNLYSIVIQDENSRKLLEAEMRINVILADLQKAMGEAVEEIVKF